MRWATHLCNTALRPAALSLLLGVTSAALGQVSPDAVLNPRLKADEAKYLPQLRSLQQSIAATKFPYPFRLARYANAKPGRRAAFDPNGIEFVYFEGREVLKISGIYQAAFNVNKLSRNERASQTFQDVIAPILQLVGRQIPVNVDCDAIGFEIVYNTRDATNAYDYEGQEVLTAVFDRMDAFSYAKASGNAERQRILNRSDIFVNGEEFGLALGQRAPLNVQALERSVPRQAREGISATRASASPPAPESAAAGPPSVSIAEATPASQSPPTSRDAAQLQAQLQAQLNAILNEDGAKFHLAKSPPPSIGIFGDETVLHLTMSNPLSFERGTTSIYKRAAQSFDLFLAPELKSLWSTLPTGAKYNALEFSVLNRLGAEQAPSETIDYICPLQSIRSFIEDKSTGQDVINRSIVLVNGVRIALNLQLVE